MTQIKNQARSPEFEAKIKLLDAATDYARMVNKPFPHDFDEAAAKMEALEMAAIKYAQLAGDRELTASQTTGGEGLPPRMCSVERVGRQVIENKLLAALNEESKVAILAEKQDLEDLIFACKLWPMRDSRGTRLGALERDLQQLMDGAFPPNGELNGLRDQTKGTES